MQESHYYEVDVLDVFRVRSGCLAAPCRAETEKARTQ